MASYRVPYHLEFFPGQYLWHERERDGNVFNNKTEFVGTNWITGGAFGAEGGVVTTAVLLLGFVFVRYAIKIPAAPRWTYDSDLPLVRRL